MCQIAYILKGQAIDLDLIPQIMVHNQDGVGVMWQGKHHVVTKRGFMTVTEVSRITQKLSKLGVPHAIHWRKATIGNINMLNVHPFQIMKDPVSGLEIYGMLNGTLNQIKIENDDDCDARLMMTNILSPILRRNPDLIRSAKFVWLLESAIGSARILMMTPKEVVIVNESKGHWENGIWFSNKYSNAPVKKPAKSYTTTTTQSTYYPANNNQGRTWDNATQSYKPNGSGSGVNHQSYINHQNYCPF